MKSGAAASAHGSWVVVDSNLWIDHFSGAQNKYVEEVTTLTKQGRACLAGPILYEVLVRIRSPDQRRFIRSRMGRQPILPTTEGVWLRAVELARTESILSDDEYPMADILIAAHCLLHNVPLFTRDSHFDRVSPLRRHYPK